MDSHEIDETVCVRGTASLLGFNEGVETPFERGIVTGSGIGDPTTILSAGCALQAYLISKVEDEELKKAFAGEGRIGEVQALTKTIGVLFPNNNENEVMEIYLIKFM